jgi:prepilin-type processing-associated H-X9-DG protein
LDHGNGAICRGAQVTISVAELGSYESSYGETQAKTIGPPVTCNADIRDGTSKTFLVGEAVPAWCLWSAWFWFDGSTATCGLPLNYRIVGSTPESNAGNWQVSYGFMSRHKSGANFAYCDGSVSFVNEMICQDPAGLLVYQALATISGGESVELPTY